MKRELKQKIKQDELVSGFARAVGWYEAHRDEARITTTVLVLLAVGAGALAYFRSYRTHEAERAFAAALETFHAPVASELPESAEKPAGPVFATPAEKYKKAIAAFDDVARRYGFLAAGVRARYYGAVCRLETGEAQEAAKAFAEIAGRKDMPLESALARLAMADLLKRDGQFDKAAAAYRELADDATLPLPRDHALMSLAATLEEARHLAEARAAYRRLAEEFPGSAYLSDARRRAEYLGTGVEG